MAQRSRINKANILVCGSNGVGKTALIVRFITKRFIGEYDQNKETVYTHRVPMNNTSHGGGAGGEGEMVLEILDPAQTTDDDDDAQLESQMRWADGFLFVYSVTDRSSFDRLDRLFRLVQRVRGPSTDEASVPLVVVANKTDCPPFARQVTPEDGRALSRRFDRPLYEVSVAESADEVTQAMDALIGQVKREQVNKVRAAGPPPTNQKSPFTNVKWVIKRKIYNRSRSDTTTTSHQRSPV